MLKPSLSVACLSLLTIFPILHPLSNLSLYYAEELRAGRTNEPLFATVEILRAAHLKNEVVLIDQPVGEKSLGRGSGPLSVNLRMALEVLGYPHRSVDLSSPTLLDPANRCADQLVVMNLRRPDASAEIVKQLDLRLIDIRGGGTEGAGGAYTVYRMGQLPTQSVAC